MRQLLIAFLLLLVAPAWAETRDPANHFFQPKFGDLQADLQEAKKQGKKGVFLFFEMDDCPFCERMKTTILNQAEVQDAYRAQFLIYPIDVNGDTQMTDFQGKDTTEKDFSARRHQAGIYIKLLTLKTSRICVVQKLACP